jgi:hypothetical protein
MFCACAIMSVFNEEDIIFETVSKLIDNGLSVYIIDNGCTDSTINNIQSLVGRGIIDIQPLICIENGQHVFNLKAILLEVQRLSMSLNFSWYMQVDADEIRYSPWPDLSLLEGIEKADKAGFNLIDYRLFNFRIYEDFIYSNDFENSMNLYSANDIHSNIQLKTWKKTNSLDLTLYGGHIPVRDNPLVYPLKFILKHYPIRGIEHGIKKLSIDRLPRYSPAEKAKGWHVHYDNVNVNTLDGILWNKSNLFGYLHEKECLKIHTEAIDNMTKHFNLINSNNYTNLFDQISQKFSNNNDLDQNHAKSIISLAQNIIDLRLKGSLPPISISEKDFIPLDFILNCVVDFFSAQAKPLHSLAIKDMQFIIE